MTPSGTTPVEPLRAAANRPILRGDVPSLRALPFLSGLSDAILTTLAPNFGMQEFSAGDVILRAGQYCDGAYFIAQGVAEVRLPTDGAAATTRPVARVRGAAQTGASGRTSTEATLVLSDMPVDITGGQRAHIEAGDIFGETSALSRYPVSSDVVASTDVVCWLIRTPALRMMFDIEELAPFKAFFDKRYRQRTLASLLRRVGMFREVDEQTLGRLRERAQLVSFKPGRVIVEQGSVADALFLVRGGFVKVAAQTEGGEVAVSYLGKGDVAGEASILLGEPWPFSLTALEHVELVKIARADIDDLLKRYPPLAGRLWETAVQRLSERGRVLRDPLGAQALQIAMDSGLIHGESVLLIDLETCTRCDECVRACADAHQGTPRFVREGAKFKNLSVPTACYQCTDPVCMIGCPTGAITRPLGTLEVTIDDQTCIGCGNCSRRCPWGNIQTVPYQSQATGGQIDLASKCDLCIGRSAGPACVQMCPQGSAVRINFKDLDRVRGLFDGGGR